MFLITREQLNFDEGKFGLFNFGTLHENVKVYKTSESSLLLSVPLLDKGVRRQSCRVTYCLRECVPTEAWTRLERQDSADDEDSGVEKILYTVFTPLTEGLSCSVFRPPHPPLPTPLFPSSFLFDNFDICPVQKCH